MSEPALSFKCLGHKKRGDLIESYRQEVVDTRDGTTVEISVSTRHLISARSMERILLNRKMFYSVTQPKHTRILSEMFDQQQLEAA